jgi:hypothetical protein
MIACNLLRIVTVGLMAIPGMPFAALCVLLFCTVLTGAPFSSVRAALLPDVLPGDKFVLGSAIGNISYQASQDPGVRRGRGGGRRDRSVPDARPGRRVVRPVGSHRRGRREDAAVAGSRSGRAEVPVGRVSRRDPDLLRQPQAADLAAVRLAGGLLHRARGARRAVRAFAARRYVHGGAAHGGHAARHGGGCLPARPTAAHHRG